MGKSMLEQAAKMRGMSPRARNEIPEPERERLEAAASASRAADVDLRAAVLAALDAGGSVRRVAEAAGLSPTTVQQWKAARDA